MTVQVRVLGKTQRWEEQNCVQLRCPILISTKHVGGKTCKRQGVSNNDKCIGSKRCPLERFNDLQIAQSQT